MGYQKNSFIFMSNGVAMAVTFFVVRIAVMPSYWHRVYSVYNTPAFNRLGYIQLCMVIPCIILDIINLYWFYKICVGAYRVCCMFFEKEKIDRRTLSSALKFAKLSDIMSKRFLVPNHPENHRNID